MNRTQLLKRSSQLPLGFLITFVIKQAWSALFGGLLLGAFILTSFVHLPWLPRYDWLFIFALLIQAFMLITRLEKPYEVITIVMFHLVGLGMELFKTSPGIASWTYPGAAFFHIATVPLFSGFMYAAVGSYMARAWRVFELNFTHYPPRIYTVLLALAIYLNFFTHHFTIDIRPVLFIVLGILYYKSWVSYTIGARRRRMPLLVGFGLIALVIWVAENIATAAKIWLYPSQLTGWQFVGSEKIGSWLLLMVISFIMVDMLYYVRLKMKKPIEGATAKE